MMYKEWLKLSNVYLFHHYSLTLRPIFSNTAGLLMENFFLSNPFTFMVLKMKKKSSAPGTGTKPHFRAFFGFRLLPNTAHQ